jgi:hypothetical protein
MENSEKKPPAWYEEVFDSSDLPNSKPGLDPFVNVDVLPNWVVKVLIEILSQNMPSIPIKQLRVVTPEKVGRFLGQRCANAYAIGDIVAKGQENHEANPQSIVQAMELVEKLQKQKDKLGVSSFLHIADVLNMLLTDFAKHVEHAEHNIIEAFRKALDQPSHKEAAEFFQGFAKGFSKKRAFTKRCGGSNNGDTYLPKNVFPLAGN